MTTPDDTYWDHEAAQLDTLLKLLPGINPDDLGPDPQKTLTEYVFPPSYKTDELTRILQHFTTNRVRKNAEQSGVSWC